MGPALSIHTIILNCQIQIEPARRHYTSQEEPRLLDLFSTREHWSKTLRPLLWTNVSTVVRPLGSSTELDLPVPCSYDFNLAATKYFDALEGGEIPLCFLFTGTVFYESKSGALQVAPIPWDKECSFRLPVTTWKTMMGQYYPTAPGSAYARTFLTD